MTIEILVTDENSITIGGNPFPIKSWYGIDSLTFIDYYSNLIENYSLSLQKINFIEEMYTKDGNKKIIVKPIQEYVSFIVYTNILEKHGVDIKNIIRQIQGGNDYYVIRHARALTELTYIYLKNGYDIKVQSRGADFIINGIKADVKVAQPSLLKGKGREYKLTKDGALDIPNVIFLSILQRMKSRFLEGVKQADLLFFNLTGDMLFSSLGIFIDQFDRIIPPKKNRLILYSDSFFPHGQDIHYEVGVNRKYLGKRTFPDLVSIKGYSIDFDPYLWNFLAQFKMT